MLHLPQHFGGRVLWGMACHNPLIYWMGENCPNAFNDITYGSNQYPNQASLIGEALPCKYGFEAAPGWDVSELRLSCTLYHITIATDALEHELSFNISIYLYSACDRIRIDQIQQLRLLCHEVSRWC